MSIDMRLVRQRYNQHKASAKKRGVEFKLTFEEWWGIWKPHWENRGNGAGKFCMCRTLDQGAYEVGNVRIDTHKGNAKTRSVVHAEKRFSEAKRANEQNSLTDYDDEDDGWLPKELRNPYRSQQESWGIR